MPAKVYTDKDADLGVFKGKTCAVIGFGSPGPAHSLKPKGCLLHHLPLPTNIHVLFSVVWGKCKNREMTRRKQ